MGSVSVGPASAGARFAHKECEGSDPGAPGAVFAVQLRARQVHCLPRSVPDRGSRDAEPFGDLAGLYTLEVAQQDDRAQGRRQPIHYGYQAPALLFAGQQFRRRWDVLGLTEYALMGAPSGLAATQVGRHVPHNAR